jgi:hypothetical protein
MLLREKNMQGALRGECCRHSGAFIITLAWVVLLLIGLGHPMQGWAAEQDGTVAQASGGQNATPAQDVQPVGRKSETAEHPPEVAPIFDQPGVLTPRGTFVFEPSVQYDYSSSNRVALVGYTVVPAITVGLINVQEVKSNTVTATASLRYGLSNRWEVEALVPLVYRNDSVVALPLNTGSSTSTPVVNGTRGQGIGDVEAIVRYQFNNGGADQPYYVGSLRFKSHTGKDPFEVETQQNVSGFNGVSIPTRLPTGSGFYGLQPGISVLLPSDPAVFFGGFSYLYNFSRSNVIQNTDSGPVNLSEVSAGDIITLNFGVGLGLNSRASFSLGYEHDSVGKTLIDGSPVAGTTRVELGTLLVGMSYHKSSWTTINVTLGVGATRDTPDMTLTVRAPMAF